MDKQPPTVVIQATLWWEVVLALVKLQDRGLAVHLPVKVCCYYTLHACTHSAGQVFGPIHMLYRGGRASEQLGGGGRGEHAKHAPLGHALP